MNQMSKLVIIKYKKAIYLSVFIIISCVITIYKLLLNDGLKNSIDKSNDLFYYSENNSYCSIPIFKDEKPIIELNENNCNTEFPDWIYISNNNAVFNTTIYNEIGGFYCVYKEINWNGDFHSSEYSQWSLFLNNTYLDNKILKVFCKSKGLFNYNEQYLFGFKESYELDSSNHPNILIVGIDSISRLAWKKFLSASYNYIENDMKKSSIIFKKVNVRGDGTTINVLAILTGEEETELYESRRNEPGAKPVDDYPWIWKSLSKLKYTTFYDEEDVEFGTFEYRLLGFENQPTDYYGRVWRMIHQSNKRNKLCMNQKTSFKFQLDSVERFFKQIKGPKFAFLWSSMFSHDFNKDVVKLDQDLLKFLKNVNQPNGIFNNTVFYLISDHGHRFDSRNHLRGKYEERLPFLAVNIPENIINKHLQIVNNMKLNENKLVTLFDAHESILDALNGFSFNETRYKEDITKVSLFYSNMPNRNCEDVHVPPHWCVCLKWLEIEKNHKHIIPATNEVIKVINQFTEEYRSKCHQLKLDRIIKAYLIEPSKDVIKFYKSDKDGRKPDLSDNTYVRNVHYRVLFKTKPGDALFESTILMENINHELIFNVNIKDIDRNNRYANWIWCITNTMRDVRKFCLCH